MRRLAGVCCVIGALATSYIAIKPYWEYDWRLGAIQLLAIAPLVLIFVLPVPRGAAAKADRQKLNELCLKAALVYEAAMLLAILAEPFKAREYIPILFAGFAAINLWSTAAEAIHVVARARAEKAHDEDQSAVR
ncbi:hypothetical protein [Amycolatopsis deserti]|nr:hypothetical protein [Amycolatopsis deserti]